MDIKITINGIEQFTEAVALLASAIAYEKGVKVTEAAAKEIVKEVQAPEVENEKIEVEKVVVVEEKVIAEGPPAATLEQVRALFVEKNKAKGNKDKLKAILTKFEVAKVTDLEEKDFEAVIKALGDI